MELEMELDTELGWNTGDGADSSIYLYYLLFKPHRLLFRRG